MATRKWKKSWLYDFALEGHGRIRKGGYRTRAEAEWAEKAKREALLSGAYKIQLADAYSEYRAATKLKDRSGDSYDLYWSRLKNELGHLYIEEVTTTALDRFKQKLPSTVRQKRAIGPATVNKHLKLVGTVLSFMWTREKLKHVPYIPLEKEPRKEVEWYDQSERDQFLDAMFKLRPEWYCFFYISMRLGLRLGEVYAIGRSRIRELPTPQLKVDRAVQKGKGKRPTMLIDRKNGEEYISELPDDVMQVIRWQIREGYSGDEFLFSKSGEFPRDLTSHRKAMSAVQKATDLRQLSHHKLGRHSVASQAVTAGESIKAVQAQLGHKSEASTHKYAHVGSKAQRRLVENLTPSSLPDGILTASSAQITRSHETATEVFVSEVNAVRP